MKIKNLFFVSLSLLTFVIPAKALVTVGGQDIKDFLPDDGKTLVYKNNHRHVAFRFRQGNLTVGELKRDDLKEVMEHHKETFKAAKRINLFYPDDNAQMNTEDVEIDSQYIVANEGIHLSSRGHMTVDSSVLSCDEPITLKGRTLAFSSCLTKYSDSFTLLPSNPATSLIRRITFVPNNCLPAPYKLYITGAIDFEGSETFNDFVVIGASEVRFHFSPEAFK